MNIGRNNDESSNDPTVLVPLSLWLKDAANFYFRAILFYVV